MNGCSNSQVILGIKLRNDGFVDKSNCYDDGAIVGSIICSDLSLSCSNFRRLLNAENLCLPEKFKFLSNHGWPIDQAEEHKIEISQLILSNIVTIQRHFELPRLGVKWHDGEFIGFIFISFNSSLIVVRQAINVELNHKFIDAETKFEFIDTHGWPVSPSQEKDLNVWDISKGNTCLINRITAKRKASPQDLKIKKKNLKLSDKKEFQVTSQKINSSTSILISYVHAEAMTHAKDLKNELINMGIDSVFLDIDDIYAGQDWQDVVNTALNNCTAFVALVTNRYGETKWTNREAKLADDKDKLIIPISFLDKWPPDQLAIQFLSLQYIPWISKEDFISEADFLVGNDIAQWNPRSVHRVAKKIKQLCSECDISTPDSSSLYDSQSSRHQDLDAYIMPYPAPASTTFNKSNLKKPLIVISAHPHQKTFVDKLIQHLDTEYELWSSITISTDTGNVCNVFDDSQSFESSPCIESSSHIKRSESYSASSEQDGASKGFSCGWGDNEYYQCEKSEFKKMVKNASLVILINSEDYNKTRICRQQAFYCEQRIEVIVIKYGTFQTDTLLLNLYPEQDMLEISSEQIVKFNEGYPCNDFIKNLKEEVIKSLETSKDRNTYKDKIQNQVATLKTEIKTELCVYIIGGTNCISKNAEAFCINLGSELAKLKKLTLVTEGFFGAGEIVGKNFCEEKEILAKGKPKCICYHILPHRDCNVSKRARQSEDGSFEKIPYGRTLFYGNSIAERDDIVSSTFKTCILIEGGERSASLAEKFLWNDCTVIPIIFNNRSISSKMCLLASIKKPPLGVSKQDWCKLEQFNSVEELAKTVKKIVFDLFKARFKILD
ncbi:uncharacterized protein [Parasteatoda tepidariorum]|nr:uncharacterized protein LOC107439186 isoform X2 [Parasteatoda tepidariorum]XP_015907179.1 uncharacterized protein LOC107439186 isoform X2 [Parasteatoda tepidariorum]